MRVCTYASVALRAPNRPAIMIFGKAIDLGILVNVAAIKHSGSFALLLKFHW